MIDMNQSLGEKFADVVLTIGGGLLNFGKGVATGAYAIGHSRRYQNANMKQLEKATLAQKHAQVVLENNTNENIEDILQKRLDNATSRVTRMAGHIEAKVSTKMDVADLENRRAEEMAEITDTKLSTIHINNEMDRKVDRFNVRQDRANLQVKEQVQKVIAEKKALKKSEKPMKRAIVKGKKAEVAATQELLTNPQYAKVVAALNIMKQRLVDRNIPHEDHPHILEMLVREKSMAPVLAYIEANYPDNQYILSDSEEVERIIPRLPEPEEEPEPEVG